MDKPVILPALSRRASLASVAARSRPDGVARAGLEADSQLVLARIDALYRADVDTRVRNLDPRRVAREKGPGTLSTRSHPGSTSSRNGSSKLKLAETIRYRSSARWMT